MNHLYQLAADLSIGFFLKEPTCFTSKLAIADVEKKDRYKKTSPNSLYRIQYAAIQGSSPTSRTTDPFSVYISGAMFIYTTHIVQNYVRVIIVWLWALILALGIGEGIRGLKRGVPFMVESTPVSAVHSTVESQHSWVGAPQAFLK